MMVSWLIQIVVVVVVALISPESWIGKKKKNFFCFKRDVVHQSPLSNCFLCYFYRICSSVLFVQLVIPFGSLPNFDRLNTLCVLVKQQRKKRCAQSTKITNKWNKIKQKIFLVFFSFCLIIPVTTNVCARSYVKWEMHLSEKFIHCLSCSLSLRYSIILFFLYQPLNRIKKQM